MSDLDYLLSSEFVAKYCFNKPSSRLKIANMVKKLNIFWTLEYVHCRTQHILRKSGFARSARSTTAYGPLLRFSGRTPLLRFTFCSTLTFSRLFSELVRNAVRRQITYVLRNTGWIRQRKKKNSLKNTNPRC